MRWTLTSFLIGQSYLDEVLMPALEAVIYWEPTDDEINAPNHA